MIIATGCDKGDTVFSQYSQSPIKSVSCLPLFAPLPVNEGALVTITQNSDQSYSFFKVDKDGKVTTKDFSFNWSESSNNNEQTNEQTNDPNGQPAPTPDVSQMPQPEINLAKDGRLRKNGLDEYYLEYYSTNTFGRNYFSVIKFDKDCNIKFQLDSTINAMEGSGQGRFASVKRVPVNGTPLNNGGYAMILQTPAMGMLLSSADYLTIRIIDSNGKFVKDLYLGLDSFIEIETVYAINNNIVIFYKDSDDNKFMYLINLSKESLTKIPISSDDIYYNFQMFYTVLFISGKTADGQYHLSAFDENYNRVIGFNCKKIAICLNVTYKGSDLFMSGFTTNSLSAELNTLDSYYEYINSLDGFILKGDSGDSTAIAEQYTMDYLNGVIAYATFQNDDGSYTVFLTQVTPISMFSSQFGDKIYIYHTEDLNKLQIN